MRRALAILFVLGAAFAGWRAALAWRRFAALPAAPQDLGLLDAVERARDVGAAWVNLVDGKLDCLGRARGTQYVPLTRRTGLPLVVTSLAAREDCDEMVANRRSLAGVLAPVPRGLRGDLAGGGLAADDAALLLCRDCTPDDERDAAVLWTAGAVAALALSGIVSRRRRAS